MIQIENISVDENYSISLWFNKDYTKENILLCEEKIKEKVFSNKNTDSYEKEFFKRNFGNIIEDGLAFAESDNLHALRTNINGLVSVLKQGRGIYEIEQYKVELFRLYNSSDNIFERYIILKLWSEFLKSHKKINSIANTMRKKQWLNIGDEYSEFADRMLLPFENKFISISDIKGIKGQILIETLVSNKSVESVYTFGTDILPLYTLYLTEFAKRGKHILTCEICGRFFVASRKDTKVCGEKCKAKRQSGYFKEHKEKVKDDMTDKMYQQNRDGYDNFIKKLNRLDAPENILNRYKAAKYDFLSKGKKKRKAYKDGKLKKSELTDWIKINRNMRMELEREIEGDTIVI